MNPSAQAQPRDYNDSLRAFVVALVGFCAFPAYALDVREKYEESLLQKAMKDRGLEIETQPDGKIIERIVVVAHDIILPGDLPLAGKIPWTWLNKLHTRTREHIIRDELLFHVGEPFRQDVFDETGRNLRSFFILSVARLVVCRGSKPGTVVILVMTKDQWSLRLNTDFTIDQARLDYLSFSISESNVAGRNKTLAVAFSLDPGRYAVGAGYQDPRLFRSRHALTIDGGVYINRNTGSYEGAYTDFTVGRPLYSLRTKWAWQLSLNFLNDIARAFQGGDLATVPIGASNEPVPFVYNRRIIVAAINFTRSWGVVTKVNLTAGFRVSSAQYDLPSNFPTDIDAAGRAQFKAILPRSEDWDGPYLNLTAYKAKYIRLQNINTFALSEDFRLGPTFSVEVQGAAAVFGLPSQFGTFTATYGHLWYSRGDLFAIGASGSVRLQAGVWPRSLAVNEDLQLSVRNVSPKFGPFRLHIFGSLRLRGHDLANLRLTLGSDSGLRAYAPRELQGNDRYEVNVELRTVALNLWTLHVGGVVFYDGGDAPKNLLTAGWKHGAGFGIRILFPQFNHDVLRLDLAFPFEIPAGGYVPRFSVQFGQAF